MISTSLRCLLSAVVVACLSACAPLKILNAFVPESGLDVRRDVAFSVHPRNKLDVYRPHPATPALKPVVVFFYGGAWEAGEKGEYLFAAEALVSRGYVVVIPDYRLYPEVVFPAYMEDAALALKWTFAHIATHGGDPDKVFVMGHSAGAQLAALLNFDAGYLQRIGSSHRRIRGLVSLAGPLDFLPLTEPQLEFIFPLPVRAASQPINFVRASAAPALLLHGAADTRVKTHNSLNLARRVQTAGGVAEIDIYPDMGHVGILLALAKPLRGDKPILARVAKFIDSHSSGSP